jgi:predicted secreted hydrolase
LEWWWWRGQVETADGRRYGFMLDLTTKPWAHVYGIDYGVTDLATGTYHYTKEALLVGEPVSTPGGFSAASRDASARGGDGRDRLRISVDGYELKVSIRATGRPVFLFGDGHLNAYCNAAYFYSRPAMQVTGTLTHSGHTARVSGTSIFDHNWGFDPAQELAGWDWLNFQLADGSAISIVVVSVAKGVDKMAARTGWMTDPGGHVTALHWQDFTATPTRYWQRDPTCRYPVDWDVVVKGLHSRAHADLDRTEMRALKSPEAYVLWPGWPLIWDGPTTVSGDAAGRGWNDLGHYCYV